MKRMLRVTSLIVLALAFVASSAPRVQAHVITLTDLNSVVDLNPHNQSGVFNWQVDGVDHMFQQWFWYRVGQGAGTREFSIDTLTQGPDVGGGRIATLTYTGNTPDTDGLIIDVTYILTGGSAGSRTSDLAETIRVRNVSQLSREFHFFQYSDFDLGGDAGDDTAVMLNANTVRQTDAGGIQWVSETAVVQAPSRHEINFFAATRTKLNDADADDLNNNSGPLTGDVTWAFQWDTVLAPGGTFLISKNKLIAVPEPATLLLFGTGLIGMAGFARRRRNKS